MRKLMPRSKYVIQGSTATSDGAQVTVQVCLLPPTPAPPHPTKLRCCYKSLLSTTTAAALLEKLRSYPACLQQSYRLPTAGVDYPPKASAGEMQVRPLLALTLGKAMGSSQQP